MLGSICLHSSILGSCCHEFVHQHATGSCKIPFSHGTDQQSSLLNALDLAMPRLVQKDLGSTVHCLTAVRTSDRGMSCQDRMLGTGCACQTSTSMSPKPSQTETTSPGRAFQSICKQSGTNHTKSAAKQQRWQQQEQAICQRTAFIHVSGTTESQPLGNFGNTPQQQIQSEAQHKNMPQQHQQTGSPGKEAGVLSQGAAWLEAAWSAKLCDMEEACAAAERNMVFGKTPQERRQAMELTSGYWLSCLYCCGRALMY
jgi:hypothetical protein